MFSYFFKNKINPLKKRKEKITTAIYCLEEYKRIVEELINDIHNYELERATFLNITVASFLTTKEGYCIEAPIEEVIEFKKSVTKLIKLIESLDKKESRLVSQISYKRLVINNAKEVSSYLIN